MGKPLDKRLVTAYASEFAKHTILKQRGFAFLLDISGKLFKAPKPSLRDVEGNTEVWDCLSKSVMFWIVNSYPICSFAIIFMFLLYFCCMSGRQ